MNRFFNRLLVIEVRGALTLEAARLGPDLVPPAGKPARLSTDGGHSWADLVFDPTPTSRVPAGGWLECDNNETQMDSVATLSNPSPKRCRLQVVDPANRTVRPLAFAPPITAYVVAPVPADAGLWVMGLDHSRRAAVSVSRDGGVTWSTSSFGGTLPLDAVGTKEGHSYTMQVSTHNGRIVHVIVAYLDKDCGFRSTDGGGTWKPTNGGAPLPEPLDTAWPGITLPAGTHVLQRWAGGKHIQPLTGVNDAATYAVAPRPGWPALDAGVTGVVREGNAGVYLTNDYRTLSYSTNGTDWHEVTPQV